MTVTIKREVRGVPWLPWTARTNDPGFERRVADRDGNVRVLRDGWICDTPTPEMARAVALEEYPGATVRLETGDA